MKKILKKVVLATLMLLPLVGCDYYIDDDYDEESSLVLTTFDTTHFTWEGPKDTDAKYKKVVMLDSVIIKAPDSLNIELDQTTKDTILNTVKRELESLGYTVEPLDSDSIASLDPDSIKAHYGATIECDIAVEEYVYYSYWYSYYGWYYYPPYVYESHYQTADLFVRMGNLEQHDIEDSKIPMLWEMRINDMVWNNSTSQINSKISSLIKDGFNQSQYLKRN